jgi:hypothetical protein
LNKPSSSSSCSCSSSSCSSIPPLSLTI